ncbi:ATP-binding protein [Streptomyces sp. NPDC006270]|uniref:ATP-binding protein n=1 Tax=Streptomyces sp. NPDC006270 TaxID=3364741 RepID=UPI003692C011
MGAFIRRAEIRTSESRELSMVDQNLHAQASGAAKVFQAGRDINLTESPRTAVPPIVGPVGDPTTSEFVGREGESSTLAQMLSDQGGTGSPVVVISGLAGIGKTALSRYAANFMIQKHKFPGGAFFVDFRGYDQDAHLAVQPEQVYAPALRALGVESIDPAPENHAPQYFAELQNRAQGNLPVLMVFDNVRDPAQVAPLLPQSDLHRVLVTSRNAISSMLPRSQAIRLQVLADPDSVALLKSKLRRGASPEGLPELASQCAGHPLALSMAAAVLASDSSLTPRELVDELAEEGQRLEGLQHENSTVRAAFERSYVRLDARQSSLFRYLSLNPGAEISLAAASSLVGQGSLSVKRTLRQLHNFHLLELGRMPGRWRMHDLVRLYAAEESRETDTAEDRRVAEKRLLSHYARVAENAGGWFNGNPGALPEVAFHGRSEAIEWLALEMPNLVAAVRACDVLGAYEDAKLLAIATFRYLSNISDHETSIAVLNTAIEVAGKDGDPLAVAACYHNLGIVYTSMRKFHEAIRHLNKAVARFRSLGEISEQANALVSLSGALRLHRGVEAGMHPLNEAMYLVGPDSPGSGFILTNLGISFREAFRFNEAERTLRMALEIHIKNGAKQAQASTLTHLATAMSQSGKHTASLPVFEEAISAYRDVRDLNGEGMAILNYGGALRGSGDLGGARKAYETALRISRETDDPHGQGIALGAFGMLLADMGESVAARSSLEESLHFLREFNEPIKKKVISEALERIS